MATGPNRTGNNGNVRLIGRPPASDGVATRRAIINAASRQLASVGYDGMTLDEVATSAGITRAAIYRYFGSKRELARAAVLESYPAIEAEPVVGARMPSRIRSVVVLPAPLGPSRPKTSPASTVNETSRTAQTSPPGTTKRRLNRST